MEGRAEGVGGLDAADKPTWSYSRRPLACPTETEPHSPRAAGYTRSQTVCGYFECDGTKSKTAIWYVKA
jgi:hypothetical protein